ncbi:MAG: SGNH/GDSL hydrolase family protein [Deltaproteobacteria bacterium]|nr:SGNH/GDSL hydrolase family protein [Deltaproteobacteria bacterium]
MKATTSHSVRQVSDSTTKPESQGRRAKSLWSGVGRCFSSSARKLGLSTLRPSAYRQALPFALLTSATLGGLLVMGSSPPAALEEACEVPVETAPLADIAYVAKQRPTRVLLIGDSHVSSTFGRALDLLLRSREQTEVTTVGSCGMSPSGFTDALPSRCGVLQVSLDATRWSGRRTRTPQMSELLNDTLPDLTVVELGANQIHSAWRNPERAKKEILALADEISAKGECLWVGPPYGREKQKPARKIENVYRILEDALEGRCTLLDSRPSALPFLDYDAIASAAKRRGDGRHFDAMGTLGQQAARKWALSVFKETSTHLGAIEKRGLDRSVPRASFVDVGASDGEDSAAW